MHIKTFCLWRFMGKNVLAKPFKINLWTLLRVCYSVVYEIIWYDMFMYNVEVVFNKTIWWHILWWPKSFIFHHKQTLCKYWWLVLNLNLRHLLQIIYNRGNVWHKWHVLYSMYHRACQFVAKHWHLRSRINHITWSARFGDDLLIMPPAENGVNDN